jgi:hypothetical protein
MHQKSLRKCFCSGFGHFPCAGFAAPGNCGLALGEPACRIPGSMIAYWSRQLCTMGLTF